MPLPCGVKFHSEAVEIERGAVAMSRSARVHNICGATAIQLTLEYVGQKFVEERGMTRMVSERSYCRNASKKENILFGAFPVILNRQYFAADTGPGQLIARGRYPTWVSTPRRLCQRQRQYNWIHCVRSVPETRVGDDLMQSLNSQSDANDSLPRDRQPIGCEPSISRARTVA